MSEKYVNEVTMRVSFFTRLLVSMVKNNGCYHAFPCGITEVQGKGNEEDVGVFLHPIT